MTGRCTQWRANGDFVSAAPLLINIGLGTRPGHRVPPFLKEMNLKPLNTDEMKQVGGGSIGSLLRGVGRALDPRGSGRPSVRVRGPAVPHLSLPTSLTGGSNTPNDARDDSFIR